MRRLIDHLTVNCQVRSPFAQGLSELVNYVNNFDPKPTHDLSLTPIILVGGITPISPITLMALLCFK